MPCRPNWRSRLAPSRRVGKTSRAPSVDAGQSIRAPLLQASTAWLAQLPNERARIRRAMRHAVSAQLQSLESYSLVSVDFFMQTAVEASD
mmetsp:Transcript_40545/g.128805  ORF Transcript_40545/g.128805 Transcript_40545/m.128805 type:complete len:90 (+) Transcript_40545:136-405(+)